MFEASPPVSGSSAVGSTESNRNFMRLDRVSTAWGYSPIHRVPGTVSSTVLVVVEARDRAPAGGSAVVLSTRTELVGSAITLQDWRHSKPARARAALQRRQECTGHVPRFAVRSCKRRKGLVLSDDLD
jgi:hypothetical protein